ncbi:hypothetical protein B9479_008137 [Cryptococcus floricola]|uniref:Uncharacterized protein n=1 Tax=Cryptococcus floricola TaxID=2591691 RepID=A0A5D3AID1_9TREE|nr:hypothetical protein B9479_008137 [Cryptococcus floricola]
MSMAFIRLGRNGNVPKRIRADLKAPHPYYFRLLKLVRSSPESTNPSLSKSDTPPQPASADSSAPILGATPKAKHRTSKGKGKVVSSPPMTSASEDDSVADGHKEGRHSTTPRDSKGERSTKTSSAPSTIPSHTKTTTSSRKRNRVSSRASASSYPRQNLSNLLQTNHQTPTTS